MRRPGRACIRYNASVYASILIYAAEVRTRAAAFERSGMAPRSPSGGWIGASLLRKEDARFLLGHGKYIADLRMPGVHDVAFVRSQVAHGRLRQVIKPTGCAQTVFTLADLGPLTILEAGPELPQHKLSPYPPLADDRVRYVGQPIAACMQPTRALAEDLADQVTADLEALPAV